MSLRITPESQRRASTAPTLKISSFHFLKFHASYPPVVIITPATTIIKKPIIKVAVITIFIIAPIKVGKAVVWSVTTPGPALLLSPNAIQSPINGTSVLSFIPAFSHFPVLSSSFSQVQHCFVSHAFVSGL
jgi:hypothetical protein